VPGLSKKWNAGDPDYRKVAAVSVSYVFMVHVTVIKSS
jgi:hypothetical protein